MFNRSHLLIALLLTLVAAAPRFYELGDLGFYGDEETTAFPARALAVGEAAVLPTGMPYRRAVAHTWLNALSAETFGLDREFSYRFSAAVLGTLTVPLTYLLLSGLVGWRIAFLTALMLALSEWHILTSREARMYAPYLFFFLIAAMSFLRWVSTRKNWLLLIGCASYVVAAMFHPLTVAAVLFLLVPAMMRPDRSLRQDVVVIAAALAAIAFSLSYFELVDLSGYGEFRAGKPPIPEQLIAGPEEPVTAAPSLFRILGIAAGLVLGTLAARCSLRDTSTIGSPLRRVGLAGSTLAAGVLAGAGQAYGFALCGMFYLIARGSRARDQVRALRGPLLGMGALLLIWTVQSIATTSDLLTAIKDLSRFPYPYPEMLIDTIPGVAILLGAALAYQCARPMDDGKKPALVTDTSLIVLLTLGAMGVVSRWDGMRYFAHSYPLFLLIASWGLLRVCEESALRFTPRGRPAATAIASLIILSGMLGAHGVPQAWQMAHAEYGDPMVERLFGFPLYPDHRGPGLFVRERATAGDIIVAEDALQQRWYIGRVDYWLRNEVESRRFLYQGEDGRPRDIYTGSAAATPDVLDSLSEDVGPKVWIITSAETAHRRSYYLTESQQRWLAKMEDSVAPVFTGRDGITRVYCLRCEETG
jgi:4-amino-4-deoxy-L-arabinose transferase-like glycosyltransferase